MGILKEHGPKDLFNAYKYSSYGKFLKKEFDLENSKFREISKDEALECIKNHEAGSLQLLIDGDLVLLKDDGSLGNQVTSLEVSHDKAYSDGSKTLSWIEDMPGSHLVKVADKIYKAEHLAVFDADKQKARHEYNRDIDNVSDDYRTLHYDDFSRGLSPGKIKSLGAPNNSDILKYPKKLKPNTNAEEAQVEYYQKNLDFLQKIVNHEVDVSPMDYDDAKAELENNITWLAKAKDALAAAKDKIKQRDYDIKDIKAALRYAAATQKFQRNLMLKKRILRKSRDLQNELADAAKNIEDRRINGSDKTQKMRKELRDANSTLDTLKSVLEEIELDLQDTSSKDTEAIQQAQERYDKVAQEAAEAQQAVAKLLALRTKRGG